MGQVARVTNSSCANLMIADQLILHKFSEWFLVALAWAQPERDRCGSGVWRNPMIGFLGVCRAGAYRG